MYFDGKDWRPGEPPPWHAPREASHFGKSAALVALLALVPLLVLLGWTFSAAPDAPESLTVRGFTAAAAMVFMGWSGWLAYRAYDVHEQDHWPAAALMTLGVEACLVLLVFLGALA
ncbi:MAG: hypothetical protein HS116_14725 [Planctomycetes bacterium]|nr:hypothetical protein [Planctomycetota bacterium]